ncbi:MAG TPA: phage BR0599 family protein, partial [Candidatus Paceibacterota bacterium]
GWLGNIKTGRFNFIAELRGMTQPLQQQIGRVTAPACDAALGDTRCGVNLANFTVTGNVTSDTNARLFTDTARAEANGYFDGGLITWTSGLNNTYRMEVKTFVAGVITLQQAMPNAISIGDTYSMSAGCDKLRATCVSKFNNIVNFRGFPDLPGADAMISGVL